MRIIETIRTQLHQPWKISHNIERLGTLVATIPILF